ncbi:MAG: hypothetical protein PHQ27_01850 [Victivallales bacterium]|nr:hypothetical protein [Victivallales bacterium]
MSRKSGRDIAARRGRSSSSAQSGQAIIESILAFFGLTLLTLAVLGVFHVLGARMITEYASYCAGRAYVLGYADQGVDIVGRAGRLGAAAASGRDVSRHPLPNFPSFYDVNDRSADYLFHGDYEYGVDFLYWRTRPSGMVKECSPTSLEVSVTEHGNWIEAETKFEHYPLLYTGKVSEDRQTVFGHCDLDGETVRLRNYSSFILEE